MNISPNVCTFAIQCIDNVLNQAHRFSILSKCSDVVPKPFMYNTVIDRLCKAGKMDELGIVSGEECLRLSAISNHQLIIC